MIQKKFTMKDWHVPFMLFELSSYAQSKELQKQRQAGSELVTGMKNFFHDDNGEEAMDIFWDNLQIGDD